MRKITIFLFLYLAACTITNENMKISSPAFNNGEIIPEKYTCKGENINPPLELSDLPDSTKSLALIVDDPDAPSGDWVHWLLWNIPPETKAINENQSPGIQGITDFKENKYGGPCPPSGTHRYYFKIYALDSKLDIPETSNKSQLLSAMESHILAKAELVGKFSK